MTDLNLTDAEVAKILVERAGNITSNIGLHRLDSYKIMKELEKKEYVYLRRQIQAYRTTMTETNKLMEIVDAHERLNCPSIADDDEDEVICSYAC